MIFDKDNEFDSVMIGLASSDKIRYWSYGEIEKPETINYRTFKAERKGLFCERIFGPVKDWECACGKYRRIRYRGVVCERCGVEVTHSKVRRERMGHIELATPVTHIWFLKGIPSYLGIVLDMQVRKLEEIVYYDAYVVIDADESVRDSIDENQLIPISEYQDVKEKYKDKITMDIGASALDKMLKKIDLEKLSRTLREELQSIKGQKRLKVAKRLRIIDALLKSGNKPEWMIIKTVPIMPPDLRPMVQLDGGRFATSDLNDLYRRIINRNNRLKRLMDIGAPSMIVRNEKRMLQEAVDVLISNGKRGRAVTGTNGRPLKSLGNIIEGKQGRFRQNLLGKRVDYSARSVIVVGPHLKFHQCGLPKEICIELFKPHVIRELVQQGIVSNVKNAKRKIEERGSKIWDILEKVIKKQPVLLNRAPTLHRLGIQAFEPILVEGSAIQIHPLVCTAFNADFDGDQMAVHLPLGLEAKAECRMLVMSTNNILSPSSGRSIVTPTQDMVLGCYYLTVDNEEEKRGNGHFFCSIDEVNKAFELDYLGVHSKISLLVDGKVIKTSVGHVIFNQVIREALAKFNIDNSPWINKIVSKKVLSDLVYDWYVAHGSSITSSVVDKIKDIGFKYAMHSGISIAVSDLTIPDKKKSIIANAQNEVEKLDQLVKKKLINNFEKKRRSNEIWRSATQNVSDSLEEQMGRLNNVFIMANSGARGNIDQVRQLAGMRGLMSDSQGRTVEIPIRSNFKEGLTLTEYFISCYGARKGLVDTALRTADSGYLTRRLVDVAQDVMITEEDCGTKEGRILESIVENGKVLIHLSEMVEGRISLETVKSPKDNSILINENELISRQAAALLRQNNIHALKVRSVFSCKVRKGVCQACYGIDLSTVKPINVGEAIGIIAAQSIGEPGTQLTMRTFHTGGVDLRKAARNEIKSSLAGDLSYDLNAFSEVFIKSKKYFVALNDSKLLIKNSDDSVEVDVPKNTLVYAENNSKVKIDDILAEFDPTVSYLTPEKEGDLTIITQSGNDLTEILEKDEYFVNEDVELLITYPENVESTDIDDKIVGLCEIGKKAPRELCAKLKMPVLVVTEIKKSTKKNKSIVSYIQGVSYTVQKGARLLCQNVKRVEKNTVLIEQRSLDDDASKTQDIVQGLPRVEELFEARKNKDGAVLAEIEGIIEVSDKENYRSLVIQNESQSKEYKLPFSKQVLVFSGKSVKIGDQLTEGIINPHDILTTQGVEATQKYLTNEVLSVYKSQGVQINLKHIDIIVKQMTKKIIVVDSGDSLLLPNEMLDHNEFEKINEELVSAGKSGAEGKRELLGVTRASLNTDSFIASASFQQTQSVLAKSSIHGDVDKLDGLKQSVIIGSLVPAGTGLQKRTKHRIRIREIEPVEVNEKTVD